MLEVQAENLTVEYELLHEKQRLVALWNVDLHVRPGEFMVLVGPSGCGKTTFIYAVVGLVVPSQGRILVGGKRVRGPGPDRAMVFQDYALMPWRSVESNVRFGLEMQGRLEGADEKVARAIQLVGLESFEHSLPYELSGGMCQRVGLARALATEPDVLLLDEPFGAIDALTREVMQVEFEKILMRTRQTVILITHSIDEAIIMGDRIAVMTIGPDPTRAVLDNPISRPRCAIDLKAEARFHELREGIWELLQFEHRY